MPSLIRSITQQLESLSAAEKQIAKYVIQNPDLIPNMTTKELSTKTGVSEASIVRFCKSIGMGSFKSFKLALVRDLTIAEMNITDVTNLQKNDSPYESIPKSNPS